jgi:hypothetical protein
VSSYAITYRNKLWRNHATTKRRMATGQAINKEDIIFNLAMSGGMSGVTPHSLYLAHNNALLQAFSSM